MLIDSDNLLGPRQVIRTVYEQIQIIQRLKHDATGADRHALFELQTQFAEFASWLYQDLGEHEAAVRCPTVPYSGHTASATSN